MFSQVARIHESLHLGGPKRAALSYINEREEATLIYHLFYPQQRIMTKGDLTARFAREVGVFVDVVYDILKENSLPLALAQESNKSTSQGWSIDKAMGMMELIKEDAIGILDVAHKMDEMEARLFWKHIVGERAPITPRAYVICLGVNELIPIDVMKRHTTTRDDLEVIDKIFNDPSSFDAPFRWHEEPNLALTPRRYFPFHPHDDVQRVVDYNGGLYQRILSSGATKMLYVLPEPDGSRLVWRDRSGGITSGGIAPNDEWLPKGPIILETASKDGVIHVYDVIMPRYPDYTLEERLTVFSEHIADFPDAPLIVHQPSKIDKMSELISTLESDALLRFPSTAAFDPFKSGGFVLMTSQAKAILRLHSIRKVTGDRTEIKVSCLDGFDDFIPVVMAEVTGDTQNHLHQTVSRMTSLTPDEQWQEIESEIVIPLSMIVPSMTLPFAIGDIIQDAYVLEVREDLGISDITQYVDLLHRSDD